MPRPTGQSFSRRTVLAAGLAAVPLAVAAPAFAKGNFPSPGPVIPRDAILTYDDMIAALRKIEHSSQGSVTVTTLRELGITPGVSEAGRDLYVATVGTGPKHVWLQGRIHGNEPYGVDSLLAILKSVSSSGSPAYSRIREELTLHIIPMYNPDGSELYIRHTILQDGTERRIDLNRDWALDAFAAKESQSWYAYWAQVKPAFGLDIHHQGLKTDESGDAITMSLGISLSPSGPTLPFIKDGLFDIQTRQMQGLVYNELKGYGYIAMDRYSVSGELELDIHGGVSSATMLGLNWNNLNPTGHSHPMVFFETYGGPIGQKSRGKAIKQNVLGTAELLDGLASGDVWNTDPMVWHNMPRVDYTGYITDDGVVPGWPMYPPVG
ncbi:Tat (twin-arginine translocation) pathway signal sequence [Ornithinimicrobium faecis]|uniref:Tat (Twin-arginine translocation) pathway signal sequence n=1 Tax=Ornithinimicrobium faecis TaxID=2934158 RepID=A0ABY4YQX7_9MICO|nr:M14 family zinc carboxypeptidase [Ornithinimicrobium sp. HY1793]USQ79156.1 Tat (twin-arginine translocation) pathway signal sequence [Ornithinimicrobium sp. HY1793]